ncbi:TRAP transporter substrate-binding protein [Marinivivus vitaminiproducens]|uniref:TRAP transporter substrate-binding protein n=1 Tax=Marinivivus vitaminiproducens TaxID=3035935 RepID=UPI00279DA282|nr:TRAP transporter substrate-binding protein [Geminicoccaceae bacterium SCSIO 64248]
MSDRLAASGFCVVVTCLAALTAGPLSAQTTLRLGHDQVADHTYNATSQFFAERVAELTNGEIEIRVFPSATLGTETSMLQEVASGNLDLSISTTANASSFVPQFGILSVGYLFSGADHFRRTVTDERFNALLDELITEQDPGFKRIATITSGARSLYTTSLPVHSMDDISGIKMRVMASPVESTVWSDLGTLPVSIPFGDVYTAMQTGLIQAAENSPGSYVLNKHYEVAPYFSLTEHQWPMSIVAISPMTWDRLTEQQQQAIVQAGKDASAFGVDNAIESDNRLLDEMAAKYGVTITKVDTAPFVASLAELQDETAEDLGTEGLLARIRELK